MSGFSVRDAWGNYIGTITPSGDGIFEGYIIGLGIFIATIFFFLIYILIRLLISLVANGFRAMRDKEWGKAVGYLILPFIVISILLYLFIGSAITVMAYFSANTPEVYTASTDTQGIVCKNNLPSRLSVGMIVNAEDKTGSHNCIRNGPGQHYGGNGCPYTDTELEIIGGPVCTQYLYWEVRVRYGIISGNTGWVAEGDSSVYWLTPIQQ